MTVKLGGNLFINWVKMRGELIIRDGEERAKFHWGEVHAGFVLQCYCRSHCSSKTKKGKHLILGSVSQEM